jgi:hypothetical protein
LSRVGWQLADDELSAIAVDDLPAAYTEPDGT